MSETFAPTVHVMGYHGGSTVTPRGWMWILAFALAGCEWALKEADTDEFRALIRADLRQQERERADALIADLERQLDAAIIRRVSLGE